LSAIEIKLDIVLKLYVIEPSVSEREVMGADGSDECEARGWWSVRCLAATHDGIVNATAELLQHPLYMAARPGFW